MNRSWMDDAACLDVSPEIFFRDREPSWSAEAAAKRVCSGCSVRDLCLADTPVWDEFSIRGGLTAKERKKLRRKAAA